MTPAQLDLIPISMLRRKSAGCLDLISYLRERGLQMTLLDLEQERARRGIARGA